jgi:protein O-GlcNAc transferase
LAALRHILPLYQRGELAAARTECRAALEQFGDQPEFLLMLGAIEAAKGEPARAVAAFRRCIVLMPGLADAYANLGGQLLGAAQATAAILAQSRALMLAPDNPEFWTMLANAHLTLRDGTAAQASFAHALRLKPDSVSALLGLGKALRDDGGTERAVSAHRAAVVLSPDLAEAWQELGHSARRYNPSLAADAYARGSRLAPDNGRILSELFAARRSICDWRGHDRIEASLLDMIEADSSALLPLADLLLDLSPAQQHKAARRFARDYLGEARPWRAADTPPDPEARLTIAYLSADFHDHATAYLAAEVFEKHDRSLFRVLAYSYGPFDQGRMRPRLATSFDAFRDIRRLDADQVRSLAASDGVDILIDLKGYTAGARLDLLARRLAPVQMGWLGYPGTLGTETFDYIVGDRTVTPPEHQPWLAEAIVRLPDSYQPNDRQRPLPVATDRSQLGLPAEGVVFGALHAPHKIGPALFADWMHTLRAVPGSVLWLYAANDRMRDNLRRYATDAGVAADRLLFAAPVPQAEHIGRLGAADLMLDSFPYTGHTTTSDALWAGVPVVTRQGEGFAARVAAGLLQAAGAPELVATSRKAYVDLAIGLAQDRHKIAEWKRRLAQSRWSCPLFDSSRFTRHLEAAYRIIWCRHAAGLPPQSIDVPPLP